MGEGVYWNHFICLSAVCPSALVCPDDIFLTAQPFLTRLVIVMYYHEAVCHAEKLVHCLQCQGHSEGLYNRNMTIPTISSKLLVCLQPNLA